MGTLDLNRVAIGMGKTIKLLLDLEPQINDRSDVYEHKEYLYFIAYVCRVSILDRIENNSWIRVTTPIIIPLDLYRARKETIFTGLILTVDKVKKLAHADFEISQNIESILEKGDFFYLIESIVPQIIKSQL
ncbi:MAG: hypothetical protein LBN74_00270 [Prevotella sp.]|jgi:hypothetical protein|nr:hypothetical protein [Prevotella sp.]